MFYSAIHVFEQQVLVELVPFLEEGIGFGDRELREILQLFFRIQMKFLILIQLLFLMEFLKPGIQADCFLLLLLFQFPLFEFLFHTLIFSQPFVLVL